MPYKAEVNRATKQSRLVYYAIIPRDNIGERGEPNRRILKRGKVDYHVTKGYRPKREDRIAS